MGELANIRSLERSESGAHFRQRFLGDFYAIEPINRDKESVVDDSVLWPNWIIPGIVPSLDSKCGNPQKYSPADSKKLCRANAFANMASLMCRLPVSSVLLVFPFGDMGKGHRKEDPAASEG